VPLDKLFGMAWYEEAKPLKLWASEDFLE
jgi:hypothetical protein